MKLGSVAPMLGADQRRSVRYYNASNSTILAERSQMVELFQCHQRAVVSSRNAFDLLFVDVIDTND